ncbi:hypothetical protein LX86_007923 [Lentzea aerocolonigenes]|nr:hypothetical protein [Lentzea aerocolonigenes]
MKRIESAHRLKQSVNSASQFRGDSYFAGADEVGDVVVEGYEVGDVEGYEAGDVVTLVSLGG